MSTVRIEREGKKERLSVSTTALAIAKKSNELILFVCFLTERIVTLTVSSSPKANNTFDMGGGRETC